ncbi:TolA colicin import membrane protein [Candidatus Rickettsiella viridis]|uniref:TolA colicin import membrane protein n=1 Tax=Candidatus Rickettsiella viridis TaxID=676208 RepID=A0A2Z5V7C4_9COXI|nr:cell envelope integrity protein TolA [Candidatus Rickettsiella viridis]BBB15287.1 TolA colicin import membrane protein [Candidatus Rickettsiella viridis]
MKSYSVNCKEDYRFTLLLATLFHIVLFSALFLTLRCPKPLLLSAAVPLAIIHATAMETIPLSPPVPAAEEKIKIPVKTAPVLIKPALIEKSPLTLAVKEKKIVKKQVNPTPAQLKPRLKTTITTPEKTATPLTQHKLVKKEKNANHPLSLKSLQIAQKNVQQLLQQEVSSTLQKNQMATRNAAATTKYRHLILQSIAQQWIIPPDVDKHLETRLVVQLAPGGMVLEVVIIKGSGNAVLDRSVQTAIYKASPLPVPKESGLFNSFRQINLTVRPEGLIS